MADGRKKYHSDLKEYKVSFKLSEMDYRKLEQDAKQSGVDRSKYLRALVQGAGGIDKEFPTDRANLIRQITGIATNVNQIAKYANSQGAIYFSEMDRLQVLLQEIKQLLKEVLEVWRLRKSST